SWSPPAPPPPRPTPFPYTTLFRSVPGTSGLTRQLLHPHGGGVQQLVDDTAHGLGDLGALPVVQLRQPPLQPRHLGGHHVGGHGRSEEHTSELQSRENLVCRLLLEK